MPNKAPAKIEGKLAASKSEFADSNTETNQSESSDPWDRSKGAVDYRLLFAHSIEMVLLLRPQLDESGTLIDASIEDVNPAFSSMTGIAHEAACGNLASQLLPPGLYGSGILTDLQADIEKAAAGRSLRRGEIYWQPKGKHILYQVFALDPHLIAVMGIDITAQKETQQALQENKARLVISEERAEEHAARLDLTHKLIESREAERQSIANHLHEGLLQALIGVRYAIEEGLEIEDKERRLARMTAVQATLQREIQNLRDYCNDLRPPTLAPFGLEKTIRAHVESYRRKHTLPVITLELAADKQKLPVSTRMVLFRVFQQIFKGAAARPQVRHIWVRFAFDETQATLEMQDDGDGTHPPARWFDITQKEHVELAGAFERVEGIGGMMEVQQKPGKGTLVRVTVPLTITD